MVQLNLSSGQQRHIRVKPRISEPPTAAPPESAETTAETEAPPEAASRGAGGAERPNKARQNAVPPGKAKRFSLGKETWKTKMDTVDGSEIRRFHQLRLVVCPIIYGGFYTYQVVFSPDCFHQQYWLEMVKVGRLRELDTVDENCWDVTKPMVNNGINYLSSTGDRRISEPSTVWLNQFFSYITFPFQPPKITFLGSFDSHLQSRMRDERNQ